MTDLLSLTPDELTALLLDIGEPKYRAAQMFPQLHRGVSPDEMTNIGRQTRSRLAAVAEYRLPDVRRKLVSRLDGTVKYLFGLADGNCVESVVMTYEHGRTICISSQVGCRMGCRFCASTIGGKVRDLVPGELLGQVIAAQRDLGERISNIVMMGIGEPLDNYDNVVKFLRLVSHPDGLISDCGTSLSRPAAWCRISCGWRRRICPSRCRFPCTRRTTGRAPPSCPSTGAGGWTSFSAPAEPTTGTRGGVFRLNTR